MDQFGPGRPLVIVLDSINGESILSFFVIKFLCYAYSILQSDLLKFKFLEWNPILYNGTSTKFSLDPADPLEFRVKFTQLKELPRSLYLSTSVYLFNADGIELGETNFIFYGNRRGDKVSIRGSQRFYFSGPWSGTESCQMWPGVDLSDLRGFNFVMTTAVGSTDMFQFENSSGQKILVDMGSCETYPDWHEMVEEAASAQLSLYSWQEDLNHYVTMQFAVV